jgi:hypothetical protein
MGCRPRAEAEEAAWGERSPAVTPAPKHPRTGRHRAPPSAGRPRHSPARLPEAGWPRQCRRTSQPASGLRPTGTRRGRKGLHRLLATLMA